MACSKFSQLLINVLILGGISSAHAQGTNQYGGARSGGYGTTQPGGFYGYGTAVPTPTGRGPLSQPIPPAVSSINRGQNIQQDPYRSQNYWGPALTNPPQYPFGVR
jgi:hypothetical protein